MTQMLKNAWDGWHEILNAGKLIGFLLILLVVILLISVVGMKRKNIRQVIADAGNLLCPDEPSKGMILFSYTAVVLCLCICPLTAVLLMYYQTKFYEYEWIFSYIPVTIVLSMGISGIVSVLWKKDRSRQGVLKAGACTIMIIFAIFLCGAGRGEGQDATPVRDYGKTLLLMEQIKEKKDEEEICLWAPKEILASVRRSSPEISLLYGRNIWDRSLGAYSFDPVESWQEELFEWMEKMESDTDWQEKYEAYVKLALEKGANVIILPEETGEAIRIHVEEIVKTEPIEINGNYIYLIP